MLYVTATRFARITACSCNSCSSTTPSLSVRSSHMVNMKGFLLNSMIENKLIPIKEDKSNKS
uniref:Uncharacterized protein n=1 Tax=Solanum tuberosum TaxID=4113 RepID=M1BBF5_SOLTU